MDPESFVTQWLVALADGNSQAATHLWKVFYPRMVALARGRLAERHRRAADEEDVALSAFDSFCRAAKAGRIPNLQDRDDLWRLLFVITASKAGRHVEHQRRQKRGGGKVRGDSIREPHGDRDDSFEPFVSQEPTPEMAAMISEEFERLLGMLADDWRAVALLKFEGFSSQEIAERFGCSQRTVERRLRLIRKAWEQESDA